MKNLNKPKTFFYRGDLKMEKYELKDYPYWLAKDLVWDTIDIFTGYSREKYMRMKNDIREAVNRRLFKAEVYLDDLERGIYGITRIEERHFTENEIVWTAYKYALAVLNCRDWSEAKRDLTKLFACIRAILWEAKKEVEKAWREAEEYIRTGKMLKW
jgi:hypothetical protein